MSSYRLPTTNDVFFRYLFGSDKQEHKEMLMDFINAVNVDKGYDRINEVTICNPFNLAEHIGGKETITDVKVRSEKGESYDVELQVLSRSSYLERTLFYWAKNYIEPFEKGCNYKELKPVIVISILDFQLFADEALHHLVRPIEDIKNRVVSPAMRLHYLELPKLRKCGKIPGALGGWLSYFTAGSREDFMCAVSNEEIQKALEAYNYFTSNPEAMQVIEAQHKLEADRLAEIDYALEKGREEGLEKGRKAGLLDTARKALKMNLPIEQISVLTGLSCQAIEALQK